MKIPEQVTRYMFTDPAGARNWATLWVAVDKHRNHYIYRDWPDLASYGEWATPSETLKAPKLN
jgi:hypothetical protein